MYNQVVAPIATELSVDRSAANRARKPGIRSGSFCIIDSQVPMPGIDYPRDADELRSMFPDETRSRRFIEHLRFPRGFVCRHCGARGEPWRSGTGLLACVTCREPTRVTEGTLFDGSTISLRRWLRALWDATDREGGLGVAALKQALHLADAEAAVAVRDRIRDMMASCSQSMLTGDVQVALRRVELIGGSDASCAPVVAIAIGREGRGKQRVRLRALGVASARDVVRFVTDHVAEGSCVRTSAWRGFNGIGTAGYRHQLAREQNDDDITRLSSLLRLWMWSDADAGAHDLQGSLHDFAFRYNRREYPSGLLFYRLMILAVTTQQRELPRISQVG